MPGYCPGRSSFGHHRCVTPLCCKPMWNFNCVFRLRFVKRNRESLTPQRLPMSLRLAGHVAPVMQKVQQVCTTPLPQTVALRYRQLIKTASYKMIVCSANAGIA